ncbi:hypothetical protein JCM10207_004839 [Rhodosporidiobolus poonsookiae]
MANDPSGPCCICGEVTTKSCSACSSAGVDLFFCSKEHQRLVWFAHKEACGTNPFKLPPLSEEEVRFALAHADKRYPLVESTETITLREQPQSSGMPLESLLNAARHETFRTLALLAYEQTVCMVRSLQSFEAGAPGPRQTRTQTNLGSSRPSWALCDMAASVDYVYGTAARAYQTALVDEAKGDTAGWATRLNHRLLIRSAMRQVAGEAVAAGEESDNSELLARSLTALKEWLEDNVPQAGTMFPPSFFLTEMP